MRGYIEGIICILLIICAGDCATAMNSVGFIEEGFEKDCMVTNKNYENSCRESRTLYPGDIIIKKPSVESVKIKVAPYVILKQLNDTSYEIVFDSPKDKTGLAKKILEFFGLVRSDYVRSSMTLRGGASEEDILLPGPRASALPGEKITFSQPGGGEKRVVFLDGTGKEFFSREMKGTRLYLTPEEIGMRQDKEYVWTMEGVKNSGRNSIRLVSEETARQILSDMKEIEKQPVNEVEKGIRKAAYLQYMSDAYPEEIDLYWMSFVILEDLDKGMESTAENKVTIEMLRNNVRRGLKDID